MSDNLAGRQTELQHLAETALSAQNVSWEVPGPVLSEGVHLLAVGWIVGDQAGAHNNYRCPVNGREDGQGRPALPKQRQRLCCP